MAIKTGNSGKNILSGTSGIDTGVGAEIAATIAEDASLGSAVRIRRIGAPRTPIPYAPPLEDALKLTERRIVAGILDILSVQGAARNRRPDASIQ